jgi:hypothetical protein
MKCPNCGSDNYDIYENDRELMTCEKCHISHTVTWTKGYWVGEIDGERKAREALLIWAKERYNEEVNNRSAYNIYREILDNTWQQLIDKLEGKDE